MFFSNHHRPRKGGKNPPKGDGGKTGDGGNYGGKSGGDGGKGGWGGDGGRVEARPPKLGCYIVYVFFSFDPEKMNDINDQSCLFMLAGIHAFIRTDARTPPATPRGSVGLVAQYTPQFPGWTPPAPGPLPPGPAPKMRPPQGQWLACYLWCPAVPGGPPPMMPPMLPAVAPPPKKKERAKSTSSEESVLFRWYFPFPYFFGF